jgi:soluble lytic murein transglycosylase-like protein
MAEPQTSRPFRERFLNGYQRTELPLEVQKVPPRRLHGIRRRYATWALGASLAIGGLGAPLKIVQQSQNAGRSLPQASVSSAPLDSGISRDIAEATKIAGQVATGVAEGVEAATKAPLEAMAEAPRQLALVTEKARENFFSTQVPFGSIIYREALKNDLRPELVAAMVQQESRFKPTARSPAGAQGLMQLVPKTARWMGAKNPMNPVENIKAGTKYLRYLNERFDGNQTKVIAAYNAGEGNVRRFGGVPPFRETRNYVRRVRTYEREFAERAENHAAGMAGAATEVRVDVIE